MTIAPMNINPYFDANPYYWDGFVDQYSKMGLGYSLFNSSQTPVWFGNDSTSKIGFNWQMPQINLTPLNLFQSNQNNVFDFNAKNDFSKLWQSMFANNTSKQDENKFGQLTLNKKTNNENTDNKQDVTNSNQPVSGSWKAKGYDASKGKKLADIAYNNMDKGWGQSDCKKHVREASEKAGFGTIRGNNGVQSLDSLRRNPNYKEVSASEISLKNIPDGTIGIFNPGSQGYNKDDGHTEIYRRNSNGKVEGISSYIVSNIKKADYYFIPC